jgi:hypothetical protein
VLVCYSGPGCDLLQLGFRGARLTWTRGGLWSRGGLQSRAGAGFQPQR